MAPLSIDLGVVFFRSITTDRLERGVFCSVPVLIAAIGEYIVLHNSHPKLFVWTAKANDILQKVIRTKQRLSSKNNEALDQLPERSGSKVLCARSAPSTKSSVDSPTQTRNHPPESGWSPLALAAKGRAATV